MTGGRSSDEAFDFQPSQPYSEPVKDSTTARTPLLAVAALFAACATAGPATDGATGHTTEHAPFSTAPFTHVPVDTPYLWASDGIEAATLATLVAPTAEQAARTLELVDALEPHGLDVAELLGKSWEIELIRLLGGRLDRAGLEAAGFEAPLRIALHGLGVAPVLRIAVRDRAQALARMRRYLDGHDLDFEARSLAGGADALVLKAPGAPLSALVAVDDEQLAIAIVSAAAAEDTLADLLTTHHGRAGEPRLAERLAAITGRHGLTRQGVAWAELGAIARRLLNPGPEDAALVAMAALELPDVDAPACADELDEAARALPRVIAGVAQGDAQLLALEIADDEVRAALDGLVDARAGLAVEPFEAPSMALSVAADAVAAADLVDLVGRRMRARRFKCDALATLGSAIGARAFEMQLSARLLLTGLRGFHLRLVGEPMEQGWALAVVMIHDEPTTLLRQVSRFESGYSLPTKGDGVPVVVTRDFEQPLLAATKGRVLAFAMGAGAADALARIIEGGAGAEMPLVAVRIAGSLAQTFIGDEGLPSAQELLANMPPYPPAARVQGLVATVNGQGIEAETLYELLSLTGPEDPMDAEASNLEWLVDQALLGQAMDAAGYPAAAPDEALAARLDRALEAAGTLPIDDRRIARHYRRHRAEFQEPARALTEQLFFALDPAASPEQTDEVRERVHAAREALAGDESLYAVAGAWQAAPVVPGWATAAELPSEVGRAAFATKVGSVSAPARTGDALVLVKVLERRPARQMTLDEVREDIRATLTREAREALGAKLLEPARAAAAISRDLSRVAAAREAAWREREALVKELLELHREGGDDAGEQAVLEATIREGILRLWVAMKPAATAP